MALGVHCNCPATNNNDMRDPSRVSREPVKNSRGDPAISRTAGHIRIGFPCRRGLDMSVITAGAIIIGHRASRAERRGLIEHFRKASPRTAFVVLLGRDEDEFEGADFNCPADNPPLWCRQLIRLLREYSRRPAFRHLERFLVESVAYSCAFRHGISLALGVLGWRPHRSSRRSSCRNAKPWQ